MSDRPDISRGYTDEDRKRDLDTLNRKLAGASLAIHDAKWVADRLQQADQRASVAGERDVERCVQRVRGGLCGMSREAHYVEANEAHEFVGRRNAHPPFTPDATREAALAQRLVTIARRSRERMLHPVETDILYEAAAAVEAVLKGGG